MSSGREGVYVFGVCGCVDGVLAGRGEGLDIHGQVVQGRCDTVCVSVCVCVCV